MIPQKINNIPLGSVPAKIRLMCGLIKSRITIYNWAKNGRKNIRGEVEKLQTRRVMGHLYTTQEWLEKFMRSLG